MVISILINSENLSLLPEDGSIFGKHIVRIESELVDISDELGGCIGQEDYYDDHL